LTKRYGEFVAVSNLSFEVREGEIFGLLGPNGSGKTTTVKMILGLQDADSGSISVDGIDPAEDARQVKARIGYVAEDSVLYASMTPRDAFELIAAVRGIGEEQLNDRVNRYAASLDAREIMEKPIGTLSRGNRQKAEIIAALLHRPPILILDEPLSGLDARTVRVFKEILALHVEEGGAVMFSTHILEVAEELCHRICIINAGREVATGTVDELRERTAATGGRLEDVFLKLTEQDTSVEEAVRALRENRG
ncbi:MAG: ABC transporter ATP-binding protein, partial [Spirochaetia bacterium]